MIGALMRKIFGSANDRYVKSMQKTVAKINALEPEISALFFATDKAPGTKRN